MLRTLEQVYNEENKRAGINPRVDGSPQKLVLSERGQRMVVPGYEDDVIFQNLRQKRELDISKQTSSNWNWERYNNKVIRWVDRTEPAVPTWDRVPKQIRSA